MDTEVALLHDSSVVYADAPQIPTWGWVSRCAGVRFRVFGGKGVFALRRELLRRRLLWLAACDLDIDDTLAQRLFHFEEEGDCLRLLWRPNVDVSRIQRSASAIDGETMLLRQRAL